jgi:lipopolysaccharide export system protein LptA
MRRRRSDLRWLAVVAAAVAFARFGVPTARADLLDEEPPAPAPTTQPPSNGEGTGGKSDQLDDSGEDEEPLGEPTTTKPKTPTGPTAPTIKKPVPSLPDDEPEAAHPSRSGGTVLAPKGGATKKNDDSKQPVHFESKGLRGLREKGTVDLIENVIVEQGTMRLEADHAKVYFDEAAKDVTKVVADGNVKMFKIDEDSGENIKAFGNEVVFDNSARTVVLEGNARLWRGADLVRGKKITYEMDSGWIRADRVAGEVHPPEKDKKGLGGTKTKAPEGKAPEGKAP